MRKHRSLRALAFAVLGIAALALFTFIVMTLWNWIIPPVVGWRAITYWQALGLLVLSRILFGGFRGHRRPWGWRRRMHERWEAMTPEEREKFREGMRMRCGYFSDRAAGVSPESPPRQA